VVWPETAYARALLGPLPVAGHLVRRGFDAALLFGGKVIVSTGTKTLQADSLAVTGLAPLVELDAGQAAALIAELGQCGFSMPGLKG